MLERIFFPLNIDDNGRLISKLLQPYKLEIYKNLQCGNVAEAIESYIHLLTTISHRFIIDSDYLYIDNHYYPDIDCTDIYHWMQNARVEGKINTHAWEILINTLTELKESDTYMEYGIPMVCNK